MHTPSKSQQIFLYIAPFAPLAFFKVWVSLPRDTGSLFTAACGMLVCCLLALALAWRWDRPSYFDWAVTSYFLIIAILLTMWPETTGGILKRYADTGIYTCLFAASFLPPVLGFAPFTLHYARKSTPPNLWENPIFVKINRIMTFTWAGIFAICIVSSLYPSAVACAIVPLAIIIGIGIPFNIRFPDYYLKRLGLPTLAAMRAQSAGPAPEAQAAPAINCPAPVPDRHEQPARGNFDTDTSINYRKETAMKVLALNSSPRGERVSKTEMLLDALVQGMRDAGAEVETINLRQKKINNCIGCFSCWTKTPGVCALKDDMTGELFPKWLEADIAVYATPLYHYTVNASMKAFIERTLPVLEPFIKTVEGKSFHPMRHNPPKGVVLSVAGFTEPAVFNQLSQYVNFLFGKGLLAEIYRPAAEMLPWPESAETRESILEATVQAGREIVQSGSISAATLERITQPIGDFDSFAPMANVFWKTCIQEGVTPAEFEKRDLVPRPDSIKTFMMIMSRGFNPERAAQTKAVMQFDFSGEVEGSCHFEIENGQIRAKEGSAEKPNLIVESPFEIWMDVVTGKSNGQQLFMEQKFKASGDFSLLLRMNEMFGKK
ncbi:Multimeric flavodoxin WrbA (modular protein) [Syntrophobacter sp. SbD1]|nr:Multimeric flavodoxin WrbA (modular protein) [Syntrophobacter sp. SbD1]